MAEEDNKKPEGGKEAGGPTIIIKKVKKVSGGHHGGAWKVAYADFVTAMMAFFLLLWLLNVTTDEQKDGIAEYFSPTISVSSQSGGAGIFGGSSPFETKDSISAADPFGFIVNKPKAGADSQEDDPSDVEPSEDADVTSKQAGQNLEEEAQFDAAQDELQQALEENPELQELADSLLIDQTPEGLRIQIVDQQNRSMFPLGSAAMFEHTRKILSLVGGVIEKLPNRISIGGHTDAAPYRPGATYTNWELSADRANASRRVLLSAGVSPKRIERIAGHAASELLVKNDPYSARNRRISILLLRGTSVKDN